MNTEKLIKFLNLSASENPSEALAALRKANIFLKENNTNWSELLSEENAKYNKDNYAIMHMNLLKERAYSQDLLNRNSFLKSTAKTLFIVIFILLIIVIFY